MMDAVESLPDLSILTEVGESPIFNFQVADGIADVMPASWTIPGLNLQRVLHVGSLNILSLSEDHRLHHLLDELNRLRVDMVGLSDIKRPHNGETNNKGFTYFWSGISNIHSVKGVTICITSRI